MSTISAGTLIQMISAVADAIEVDKDRLSRLDGVIGDGDHGVTMSIGFTAVKTALQALHPDEESPTSIFNMVAKSFLSAVGASAGPLYATAFMRAGAAVKAKTELDGAAVADVVVAMAQGVAHRGKAEPGNKTMVDAWHPAAEAASSAAGQGPKAVLSAAAKAAEKGAEATKDMVATMGRSANLGERSRGHIDPGAASTALILATLAKAL